MSTPRTGGIPTFAATGLRRKVSQVAAFRQLTNGGYLVEVRVKLSLH